MPDRAKEFNRLEKQAAKCRVCPNLADQSAVLSARNGPLTAKVMFVAEAPGRFGAGRTGIPFSGDQSGKNFETLLNHTGWTRDQVFITNAVLCNPLQNGNNRRPSDRDQAIYPHAPVSSKPQSHALETHPAPAKKRFQKNRSDIENALTRQQGSP